MNLSGFPRSSMIESTIRNHSINLVIVDRRRSFV